MLSLLFGTVIQQEKEKFQDISSNLMDDCNKYAHLE